MTTHEAELKERDMEDFNSVAALYSVLKSNASALRVKQAIMRADELEPLPLDYIIDVETKARRLLGEPIYNLFLRAIFNENLDLLPEYTREAMGRDWISYGLGPEGTYRKLYFRVKNEQVRSFLKEHNGDHRSIAKFDRSTGLEPSTGLEAEANQATTTPVDHTGQRHREEVRTQGQLQQDREARRQTAEQ